MSIRPLPESSPSEGRAPSSPKFCPFFGQPGASKERSPRFGQRSSPPCARAKHPVRKDPSETLPVRKHPTIPDLYRRPVWISVFPKKITKPPSSGIVEHSLMITSHLFDVAFESRASKCTRIRPKLSPLPRAAETKSLAAHGFGLGK